jgi:hypothetical protein
MAVNASLVALSKYCESGLLQLFCSVDVFRAFSSCMTLPKS